tara:strand:+ start:120 stop:422 length:303 start_codon:yes stop_codon:yes gene_type:complete
MLLATALPGTAQAQSLDQLRSQGVVGERYDGYLVTRDGANAAVQAFVEQTNAKRRAIYEKRASEQGVPPAQVGSVYAKQIMGQAAGGTWFLDAAGNWVQK